MINAGETQTVIDVLRTSPHDRQLNNVTAATTLEVYQTTVRAATTSSGSAFTITLPPVSKAKGLTYAIFMTARDTTKDITVSDAGDSRSWTNIVLNAANEYTVLESDGEKWYETDLNHT